MTTGPFKTRPFAIAAAIALLASSSGSVMAQVSPARATRGAKFGTTLRSILPSSNDARELLEKTPRCRDWVGIPYGSSVLLAFIVYPERSDKAPVVFVTAKHEGFSPWVRAVSDQIAAEGFIAIAADVLTNMGPHHGDSESFGSSEALEVALANMSPAEIARRQKAIRDYSLALPATDGQSASIDLDSREGTIRALINVPGAGKRAATFKLGGRGWTEALGYLNQETDNHPQMGADVLTASGEHAGYMGTHADHMGMMMAMSQAKSKSGPGSAGALVTSTVEKQPNLPAGFYTSLSTLNKSKLRKEWVEIPYGDVKLHTWVEYPAGEGKAGVVIVMQFGTGMDEWIRAIADQLAQEGFIAVAADMWSGTGPNGGGRDSFQFVDDAMRAGAKINAEETQRRYKAARDWAMKLPRANGKSGSIGFCAGGGNSFRFAGEVPELNAAVVYYGTPPDDAVMARIKAPILGFYGENDARVTSTVEPTIAKMEKLGKVYEPHIYPKATHSFLYFQEMAGNPAATNDAWPRTVAFFRKHVN